MYTKIMVFAEKVIISYNNIYFFTLFALIRLIITSLLTTLLIFLSEILDMYKKVFAEITFFYFIRIIIMVLSFLYV